MPIRNKEIVDKLSEVADLLDIKGENEFRVRSYRNAVRVISGMSDELSAIADDKDKLKDLPEVGESIAGKIQEILDTGELSQLKKLKKDIPASLLEMMELEQIGPQRTKKLYDELGITSIEELRKAAEEGELKKISGFGKKTTQNILEEIETYRKKEGSGRFKLGEIEAQAEDMRDYLEKKLDQVTIAGSYRRGKETVGDIDIVATAKNPEEAMDHFTSYKEVEKVLSKGETRSSVVLRTGLQVDLRVVKKRSHGAALLYFTGSKAHSIALRRIGQGKDLKVNEYGIYKGKKLRASKTEKEMYEALDLCFIPPELREDQGEFEAARKNKLPDLVQLKDIKGDLQTHTEASDGQFSLEEMAAAAEELGYDYFAVTDHSKRVSMANGLDEKRLAEQIEKIDALNKKMNQLRILKSIEVDILKDGTLDLPDSILKELDLVVCAIHYNRNLSRKKQTERVLKAMENSYFNILAHPTGRLIGEREPYDIDIKKVMKEAKDRGCFLEINANPDRLDLNDEYARMAKEMELQLSISTDAHSKAQLDNMKYGVAQARRGWLEKDDVLNTRPWRQLKKLLNRS
jgi:DNA polymerase (family 10)